ncbi:MAG: polysaccharide pyruvyl transferase family protein, partial [Candidatus Thioglobus sp.]
EITPTLSKYALKFDAISVREDSAIKLCQKYLKTDAVQVLDPTFLLDTTDYLKLVEQMNENVEIGNNRACVYILDMNKHKQDIIREVLKTKKLTLHRIGKPTKKGFPSIESWINGFDKSEFIITDSFHGTVFAILFNKPFISIVNEGRGTTRFTSLLKLFGLSKRLITPTTNPQKIKEIISSPINYNEVNQILSVQRDLSKSFLINILK